ncbi:MAG: SDR family NAD(P)-dependent oxidoreductase [Cyanobacteria bacterium P01_F01_bin.150]
MTSMSGDNVSDNQRINYQKLLLDALTEMRQMRSELESLDEQNRHLEAQLQEKAQGHLSQPSASIEPIAIIGMDCRFPGSANDPEAYWTLLSNGRDAMVEVPSQRWNIDEFYDPDPDVPGKMYTRLGGFIDDIDQFDPQFFGISPREAISLDPQQRLLLEVSYTAIERAGQSPEALRGSQTGVFIGLSFDDYASRSVRSGDPERIDAFSSLGNTRSIAVGRLSYVLGLQGPTLQLDTTCSSSLLAVHLACQSLRAGEASMALAGGVSAMLSPEPSIGFCKLKALSTDGHCKTFDADANGYSRGEGCGIVVLKRYDDAVANGDRILGIIRGSAVNHDGQSNGLTAPNGSAQADVIRQAIANANISPAQIQYVEAHGTGTSLGDPIELITLGKVLGEGRSPHQPLRVGSVKTNIGHLEASAGVAGLIKVILALQHRQIPPHLYFQTPNPYIPWDRLPVEIPTKLTAFHTSQRDNEPILAGVSSFGMSGTNVHIIVESSDPEPSSAPDPRVLKEPWDLNGDDDSNVNEYPQVHLLVLSAKTLEALAAVANSYVAYLRQFPNVSLDDLCFTAATGRSHYGHRLAIVATTIEECCQLLEAFSNGGGLDDQSTQFFCGQISLNLKSEYDLTPIRSLLAPENPRQAERQTALANLAKAYVEGKDINWALMYAVNSGTSTNATASDQYFWPNRQRLILPTYPFQRQSYWMEQPQPPSYLSTRSKHPLLNRQVPLAGVNTKHFESVLKRDRVSFIKDHRILDAAILPAAAYLEMAIAAAQATHSQAIGTESSWVVKDVAIRSAMVFGDDQSDRLEDDNTEHKDGANASERTVQLVLTPEDNDNYSFKILSQPISNTTNEWQQHAEGKIGKVGEPTPSPSQEGDRISPTPQLPNSPTPQLSPQNLKSVAVADYYRTYREIGIDYGPSLQVIEQLWQGEGGAIAQISLPSNRVDRRYNLQPTLLDAGLQSIGAALPDKVQGLYLPVGIGSFQVFNPLENEGEVDGHDHQLQLWVEVEYRSKDRTADIRFSKGGGQLVATLTGVRLQPVSAAQLFGRLSSDGVQHQDSIDDWFYRVDWQLYPHRRKLLADLPGLDTVGDRLTIHAFEQLQTSQVQTYGQALPQLEQLSVAYAVQALQELGWDQHPSQASYLNIQPNHQRLLDRLIECATDPRVLKEPWDLTPEALQQELQEKFPVAETELSLLADCGSNLAAVMRGDVDPLQLLFPNGDATRITRLYQDSPGPRLMNELVQGVIAQIANAYPAHRPLRILEIGAGTGGTTAHLLPHLQNRVTEYTFTDVSPLFLTNAQERFQEYPFVDYRVLDIEQAPHTQNLPLHHWDIVIAANVLHATQNIQITLTHVHQLLAEGGQLVVLEGTQPTLWLDLIFGLTEGWWRFNDRVRSDYPLMDESTWQQCLADSGFEDCQIISPNLTNAGGIAQQTVLLAGAGKNRGIGHRVEGVENQKLEQHWLIWADRQGAGKAIAQHIATDPSQSCSLISNHSDTLSSASNAEVIFIDDYSSESIGWVLDTVINQLADQHAQLCGIIYLAGLDAPSADQLDSEQLSINSEMLCTQVLTLVQALEHRALASPPELWLITQDAVSTGISTNSSANSSTDSSAGKKSETISGMAQSLLWGMGKAIALEYPELRCRCVDIDANMTTEAQVRSLWHEIYQTEAEQGDKQLEHQVALRGSDRYVSRLTQYKMWSIHENSRIPPLSPPLARGKTGGATFLAREMSGGSAPSPYQGKGWGGVPFRLAIAERGTIDNLYFASIERRSPNPSEVEIQVQATGLNFRDVLNALDLYPGDPGLLGCECVGRIVAVGRQVNDSRENSLQVGDEVMAIAPGSFSQFITIDANLVVYRPRSLTVEEAATLPVTFLTAYYALYHLGGLGRQKAEGRRQKAEEPTPNLSQEGDRSAPTPQHPNSSTLQLDLQNLKSKIQNSPTPSPSQEGDRTSPTPQRPNALTPQPSPKNLKAKTVLVHAASGGVGQAAIQLAHLAGAEVFATASPAKWEQVRQLGVARVANSRSLDFADEVMEWTGGEGVDLVLNSLSGDFIAKSLACVKSGGHFIEIGKRDVWSSDRVAQAYPDIAYTLVDMVEQCRKDPGLIQEMLGAVARHFENGDLQPLPQMIFPIDHAPQAFRTMQQAQHVGKIVITHVDWVDEENPTKDSSASVNTPLGYAVANPTYGDGTFLITGGLGGLGLQFADWLVEQGVKHLALVSRREPDAQQQQRIQSLETQGARVQTYAVDVANIKGMIQVMQDLEQSMPSLKGIIHGAGLLDDGVLRHQTWERFERVLGPKVQGAWNLHQLAQASDHAKDLEHFILFSSATALLGSPGQANHVTANTFLDTLAHHRRALGLPALSINWGVWSDIGSAAQRKADETMAEMGIGAIAPNQGVRAFEKVITTNPTQVGVLPVNWSQFFRNGIQSAFLSELERAWQASNTSSSSNRSSSAPSDTSNFVDILRELPESDRHSALAVHICHQIAQVLGFKAEDINPDKGFFDLGMDSLTSVELKNKLQSTLGFTLSPTVAFDYPTVNQLANHLLPKLLKAEGRRMKDELKAEGRRQKDEGERTAEEPPPSPSQEGERTSVTPQLPNSPIPQLDLQNPKSKIQNPKSSEDDFSEFSDEELLELLAEELAQGGGA